LKPLPRRGSTSLAADKQGHFGADALISGKKVRVLFDTGATLVALSRADAELLGLNASRTDFKFVVTANGSRSVLRCGWMRST